MPATSEAQRKAMYAAAAGKSTLGIPQKVGKEFISKDAELIRGAGIMLMAPDGRVLFIKRSKDSPHPGTYDLPGGKADDNETPEQTAKRECMEEVGALPYGELKAIYHEPDSEGVEFITYLMHIKQVFTPKLEESEHTKFKWRTLEDAPKHLHPGVQKVVEAQLGQIKDPGTENAVDIPAQDDFEEGKHPRSDDGKFGSGNSPSKSQQPDVAEQSNQHDIAKPQKELSKDQAKSVKEYTTDLYEKINKSLRQNKELTGKQKQVADELDSLINNNVTKEDMTVYRGVSGKFVDELIKGNGFVDAGFSSVSSSEQSVEQFMNVSDEDKKAIMKIEVPKGSRAMSVRDYSDVKDEEEIVLGRFGTFYVTGVTDGDPKIVNVRYMS